MIFELIYGCMFCLNCFPSSNGVLQILSPRAIMIGLRIDYHNHYQLGFGEYAQTHEQHNNSMEP
jgi:hypothetical protein